MAGLSHAAKAPSRARSLYWLALFLAGLVFTIRGMVALVQEFQGYPVVTSSKLITRSSVPFPAITLCNLNRVNCHDAIIHAFNLNLQLENLYEEGGEQEELEVLQRELASLWSFSTSAECFSSMCDFMAWSSLGVRVGVGDPEGDELVFIMASFLQCQENYEDRVQREGEQRLTIGPSFHCQHLSIAGHPQRHVLLSLADVALRVRRGRGQRQQVGTGGGALPADWLLPAG